MPKSTFDTMLARLALTRGDSVPLHVQLAGHLRALLLSDAAPSGTRLPSSRALAAELSVSRITVTQAYDQLKGEGYLEGRAGAGMFVAAELPDRTLQAPALRRVQRRDVSAPQPLRPFQAGIPDPALFPHAIWARLLDRAWRAPQPGLLALPDPLGWGPLRMAIAAHLADWRGMACTGNQVIVTSSAGDAMDLISRTVWQPGDEAIIEAPGYAPMRDVLGRNGVRVQTGAVDTQGLQVEEALAAHPHARGVIISPSRHYPTGVSLPPARRLALLDWAGAQRVIVEDDYDSEFRYQGAPLPAMASLDQAGSVFYVGSFSKVLSPALRIGFLVVPARWLDRVAEVAHRLGPRASLVPQPALASFIETGDFARHIRRMRRAYAARQTALLEALRTEARELFEVHPEPAGMHLTARMTPTLRARISDRDVEKRAARQGLTVRALSGYFEGEGPQGQIVLGYAGFDEAALREGVSRLVQALN